MKAVEKAKAMDTDPLIRTQSEKPAPEPQKVEGRIDAPHEPTECGLTREELRAIVAEIIG